MKRNKKEWITWAVLCVLKCEFYKKILNLYYDNLIFIDLDEIIKKYNDGDYKALYDEDVDRFIKEAERLDTNPKKLIEELCSSIFLLKQKNYILREISILKNKGEYDENQLFYEDNNRNIKISYKEINKALVIANDIYNYRKVYEVLYYLLKNYRLCEQIKEKRRFFEYYENNPDDKNKFLEVVSGKDNKLGCISMGPSSKFSNEIGTEAEMALSELIGSPFTKDGFYDPDDMIVPEYWHSVHAYGGLYQEPYDIVKEFVTDISSSEQEKIRSEQFRRNRIEFASDANELGFVLKNDLGFKITKRELIQLGIDPDRIGWESLRIKKGYGNPINCFKYYGASYIDMGKCLVKIVKL